MENRGIREACENTDRFILNECAQVGVRHLRCLFVHKKSHHLIETISPLKQ